jgi:4-hydroxy-2-oxoheptanedioate aldolase
MLFASGRLLLGAWCHIPSGYSAELIARAGFDWVCIDTQHGLAGDESMVAMLQAMQTTSVSVLVRVRSNDPGLIGRALDMGAHGVIVPLIDGPEDALKAVQACRCPPDGNRSWGPTRAALDHASYSPRTADAAVVCIVQVETRRGVRNVDEILATPGIDGVYVGPNDLAVSYGLQPTGEPTDPEHLAAIETILEACLRHQVTPGIHCGTTEAAIGWMGRGFRMINVSTDARFMLSAANESLMTLRGHETAGGTVALGGKKHVSG